jgi:hypothetical protein
MLCQNICGTLKCVVEKDETRTMMMIMEMAQVAMMDPLQMMFLVVGRVKDCKAAML